MKEIRCTEIRAESTAADGALILTGTPIVFDEPTTINDLTGQYTEIIKRGALDGAALDDSRLLYNHDTSVIPLARTPKTMKLDITDKGLTMRAELADTETAKSVYTAVKRGDLTGMSFAFKVPDGGDAYDPKTHTRTIKKIEKVYEVSVVPFPAYPTTSVEARAVMDTWEDPARKRAIIMANRILMKEERQGGGHHAG